MRQAHRRVTFAVGLIFYAASRMLGQDDGAPAFEVASIRPDTSGSPQRFSLFPEFTAQNATLKDLLTLAYDVKGFQLSGGPAWINSDRYDISAKAAGTPTPGLSGVMLQRRRLQMLLQDTFKLTVHRETKELPIYELVVAKGGPNLQAPACIEGDPQNPRPAPGKSVMDYCGSTGFFKGQFEATATSMPELAKDLANELDRPVVDKTGISGTYRVQLTFTPEESTVRVPDDPGNPVPSTDLGSNFFTAVQEQLGLKLQSAKGPVEVLVIDRVVKPSEN